MQVPSCGQAEVIQPQISQYSLWAAGGYSIQKQNKQVQKLVLSDALALHSWHFCNFDIVDSVDIVDIGDIVDIVDIVGIVETFDIVDSVDIVDIVDIFGIVDCIF